MAKAQRKTLENQLAGFQGSITPQTQEAYGGLQNSIGTLNKNIAGLLSPEAYANANQNLDTGLSQYDQQAQEAISRGGQLYDTAGGLMGKAAGLPQGYTPEEKQGMNVATAAGFAAPYAAASGQAQQQALRTGQTGGVSPAIAGLARERGRMISAGLGGLQQQFGQARIAGQQFNTEAEQKAAGLQQSAAEGQRSALQLSQFPQMARLQRMQQERESVALGAIPIQANQQTYQTGVAGQENALGIREQEAARPSFLSQLALSAAGGAAQTGMAGLTGGLSKAKPPAKV